MDVDDYVRTVRAGKRCCADSGFRRMVHKHFNRLMDNNSKARSLQFLRVVLNAGRDQSCSKRGKESTIIEHLFSICRMLGLIRLPA